MAQCKQSAAEVINNAFAPMVAALCSHDAELVCQKNNLSFCELIQPFCRLNTEAHIRDPTSTAHPVHNLHVNVREMSQIPPSPTMARKMLTDVVANCQPQTENSRTNVITVGDYDLQLSASTPWYEAYRDCFLQVAVPSDHEFLKHYLACIFVVTSSHPDPMEQFSKLTQQQHQQQHQNANKLPKWFCPNVLRYYVLLHDVVDGDEAKAESMYQNMKSTYGVNACHLLQINSRPQTSPDGESSEHDNLPDPWTQFLSKKPTDIPQESGDYESSQSKIENEAFPTKLAEGTNELVSENSVEDATEVTEDSEGQTSQTSVPFDHPLAQDSTDSTSAGTIDTNDVETNVDNRIPRDSQNNAISIQLREKTTKTANQHGHFLTLSDHDRIRIFVHEFIVRGLIPWAERTLRLLSEQLTSRKGIHRSFFNATKKWFGGSKPGGPAAAVQEKANVVYTLEAPEMQTRRLADLAFMFQLYEIAYQTYQTCKRDFNNDHAWLYFAGATEMACMSVFMQGNTSQRQYPHLYMDTAVTTYLSTCKSPQFATRATMLSTEALKSRGMYAEAAMQFIKMTSEDSDLRSALLLEQAAHCFINMKAPMVRKFSFHMILAGHRFGKAGQRKHALRSYSQALQVYKGKNWTLAEDHINFTIGRQSFNLKQLENACAAFKHLLTSESKQTPPQQAAFLREYLFVYKQLLSLDGVTVSPDSLPQLPLPVVDGNKTNVLLCKLVTPDPNARRQPATSVTFESPEPDNPTWAKLEELIRMESDSNSNQFRPSLQHYTNQTNNSANPVAIVGETVTVEVELSNPLKIPLLLTDVLLLWRFIPVDFSKPNASAHDSNVPPVTNEVVSIKNPLAEEVVETEVIKELVLSACESKPLHLQLTPRQTGELHIVGLAYNLGTSSVTPAAASTTTTPGTTTPGSTTPGSQPAPPASQEASSTNNDSSGDTPTGAGGKPSLASTIFVRGRVNLDVQGPRLNVSKAEKASKMYGPDRRLDIVIAPEMPRLEVHFTGFPRHMLCGEIQHVTVEFTNNGSHPLLDLKVASSHPAFFTFGKADESAETDRPYEKLTSPSETGEYVIRTEEVKHVMDIELPAGKLSPGATVSLPMWIRGPNTSGQHKIDFLFHYKSEIKNTRVKHRVLRHMAEMTAHSSLGLKAVATRGATCSRVDSARPLSTILVNLEAENLNQVQDPNITNISLVQVSCASCRWHLRHLTPHSQSEVKLKSRETIMLSFKAHSCSHACMQKEDPKGKKSNRNEKSSQKEVVFTNVTFDQPQLHSAITPCADFYLRSRDIPLIEDIETVANNTSFQVPESSDGEDHQFDDLEVALKAGLTLIVIWKAQVVDGAGVTHEIMGQHHATLERLNTPVHIPPTVKNPVEQPPVKIIKDYEPDKVNLPSEVTTSQLVSVHMLYNHMITHDFEACKVAMVTVQLQMFNCSSSKLDVLIDTTKKTDRSSPEASRTPLPPANDTSTLSFTWIGHSLTQFDMEPTSTKTVPLRACFVKPGVYNLSNITVTARPTDLIKGTAIDPVAQKLASSSLLTVQKPPCTAS